MLIKMLMMVSLVLAQVDQDLNSDNIIFPQSTVSSPLIENQTKQFSESARPFRKPSIKNMSLQQIFQEYRYEALGLVLLLVYLVNYSKGKAANQSTIFNLNQQIESVILQNFAHIGFTDKSGTDPFVGQSAHQAKFYASGRDNIDFLEISYSMRKRQDFLYLYLYEIFFPERDTITFDIGVPTSLPLVFSIASKSKTKQLRSKYLDLSKLTGTLQVKNLPKGFQVEADTRGGMESVLTTSFIKRLNTIKGFQSLYFTDQKSISQSSGHIRLVLSIPKNGIDDLVSTLQTMLSFADSLHNVKFREAVVDQALKARQKFNASKEKQDLQKHRQKLRTEKEMKIRNQEAWIKTLSPQRQRKENQKRSKKDIGRVLKGKTMKIG